MTNEPHAELILRKAAHLIRKSLACKGLEGHALYTCALAEAAEDYERSFARVVAMTRAHALMRLDAFGDPGPGPLPTHLDAQPDPEDIADACEQAAMPANLVKLEGFNPSTGRNPAHWSETNDD